METLASAKSQTWLPWFARGLLILSFLFLAGRLTEVQVIKGKYFRGLAESNRVRKVAISAPRGRILARGGEVLAGNKEVKKRLVFNPQSGYEKSADLTGAADDEIINEWVRDYPLGSQAAHISGYVGEINENEIGKVDPHCIEKGSRELGRLIGRSGLEEEFDCVLAGLDGEELVEVDTRGIKVRTLGRKQPVAGADIKTTIDFGLQKQASELMTDKAGAVVVTDAGGQVLALYSSPSFDPNIFVGAKNAVEVEKVINNPDAPLFNRAIGGLYHPGSTYKPLVAVAALAEGLIDEDFLYEDTGAIEIKTLYGDFSYTNWYFTQYGRTEGKINIVRALGRSTDTFFYKLGEMLGVERLDTWSARFKLDAKTGIDLPGEAAGLVPGPAWKEKERGEKWFLGNTYHLAIGQGDLAVSPLHINGLIAALAADGKYCGSKLVGQIDCENLRLEKKVAETVKKGMAAACTQGGTGYTFFDFNPRNLAEDKRVACKTGTAETGEKDIAHAWFTVFAPVETPEIVVTVLVEKGGEGSKVAGPIAREIMDYWFGDRHE